MKGLEISEVRQSALERTWRLDAEFYSKEHLRNDDILKANYSVPLTDFANISDGNHMGISDEFSAVGIPYYRGGEVKSFFMEMTPPLHRISEEVFSRSVMRRSHLKKGDVLVTIVGTIGSVATVVTDEKAICSCKIAILRPKDLGQSFLIGTFLRTRYGQSQIARLTRGSVQMGFVLDDFSLLLMPMFSSGFCLAVDSLVSQAYDAELEARKCYREAEQMLLAELGFAGWSPEDLGLKTPDLGPTSDIGLWTAGGKLSDVISPKSSLSPSSEALSQKIRAVVSAAVKPFSAVVSASRFDAEYFQPKYDEIEQKIKSYKGGTLTAQSCLVSGLVNEEADTKERYVELADIGANGEIEGCVESAFGELPSRARQRMAAGQVIASSIEGSLDRCALVMAEYDSALCSTGFHRFKSDAINPGTMLLLFKSWPIQQLMKRGCSGTILCGILPGELAHITLPIIAPKVQAELAAKVQSSFALRAESKRLLEKAKAMVETAIEHGEEMTMEDLGLKTSDLEQTSDIGRRTDGGKPSDVLSPESPLSPTSEVLSQNPSPQRKERRR